MNEVKVYLLPHWTVSSIREISDGNLDVLVNEGYEKLKGRIAFKDFTDGALCMDSFNTILKLGNGFPGNNLIQTYCPYFSESITLYTEILDNLKSITKDCSYRIHNINDDTIVIEMLPGFSTIVSVKSKSLVRLYSDILSELLKIASFSSVAGTKLYGCYLRAV